MARNLMTDAHTTQAAPVDASNAGAEPTLVAARTSPVPLNEVLAGAFPKWDLLPATPFLRRVR